MSSKQLTEQLRILDEINHKLLTASCLSDAAFSVDQENEEKSQLLKQVTDANTAIHQQLIYFSLELKKWKQETLRRHEQELPEYQAYLRAVRTGAKHALSEAEEKIISTKDKYASNALTKIYDLITGAYLFTIEIEGETKQVTKSELSMLMQSTDRTIRKKARDSFYEQYEPDKHVLNEIYTAIIGDFQEEAILRGYNNPIDVRHQRNEIEQETYTSIVQTAKNRNNLFIEYIDLKKQILGYKTFYGYDIRANIPGLPKGLPYKEAKQEMLAAFSEYAGWMKEAAKQIHTSKRIDALARKNKRGGACCYEVAPGEEPILILNHEEDYESLKTLAHETGHAIHDVLAAKHTTFNYHPQLVLAETASNLAENLIFEKTLRQANKQEQQALLCDYLDDALASISAQLLYTEFEEYTHKNPDATLTQRCNYWSKLQQQKLPNVKRERENKEHLDYGWISIPHIYQTPFYCYAYSFGLLLALSLKQQASPETIKNLLEAGGSKTPKELLAKYGFDITTTQFWNEAFNEIELLIKKLRRTL